MMNVVRIFVMLRLCLAMMLGAGVGSTAAAQDASCAPVAVGEGSGVFFLALGDSCSSNQADGYTVIADLVRDNDGSEVLVLVDAQQNDAETLQVAQVLAERVKDGSVDGGTWHDQPVE